MQVEVTLKESLQQVFLKERRGDPETPQPGGGREAGPRRCGQGRARAEQGEPKGRECGRVALAFGMDAALLL